MVGQILDFSEEFDNQFPEHVGKRRHFGNCTELGPPEPSDDVGHRRPGGLLCGAALGFISEPSVCELTANLTARTCLGEEDDGG